MKKISALLLALLLCVTLAGVGYADPPAHANKGRGAKKEKNVPHKGSKAPASRAKNAKVDGDDLVYATITALTAREIARQGGWTGYQPLPPGIAKNMLRGKPLPPGIAKKSVPPAMLKKLPSYPGYEWYSVGRDLVLVSMASMVIADVLHDVFD